MEIVRRLVRSQDYVVRKYSKTHPYKALDRVQVGLVQNVLRRILFCFIRRHGEELSCLEDLNPDVESWEGLFITEITASRRC